MMCERPSARNRRLGSQGGFAIADAVAATAMLAIGIFAAFYSMERGIQSARYCHQRQAALEAVQSELELARATPLEELTVRERAPFNSRPEGLASMPGARPWLTVEQYGDDATDSRKVTAGVDWFTGKGRRNRVQLVTLVGPGEVYR